MTTREARRRCDDDAGQLRAPKVLVSIEGHGTDLEVTGIAGDVLRPQSAGKSDRKKKQQRGEKNPSHHPRVRAGAALPRGTASVESRTIGVRSRSKRAM